MSPVPLPVEECLEELGQRLRERDEVILQAPPGAGKTTRVPLALLDADWLGGRKILLLEPRRIAARNAAYRMAGQLGESPGQTVGYRMRLETRVGGTTRIEIITEGILTRMLQQDPALDGVGLVIFDEFHERNLESDLALALCLQGRALFAERHRLKILLMSATLQSEALSALLADAPIVISEGRAFPVDIVYGRARQTRDNAIERMQSTIKTALADNPGSSLLAFLPGQGEIHRVADSLAEWLRESGQHDIELCPLYGNLSIDEQQRAIAPPAAGRKVVLATNIAETSLTIDGVDVVVDSGLAREARFDPATGMTGLHTVRISRASSEQRAGRAGRLRPGKCYRLWSAEQQRQLAAHSSAEILQADLAPLALQLLQWGEPDPGELAWLDPPPRAHWNQALDLLDRLGAIDSRSRGRSLSAHGEAMTRLPVHPRLAHLLLRGAASGHAELACRLASLLSERDPFGQQGADIEFRLELLAGGDCPPAQRGWCKRVRRLEEQLRRQLDTVNLPLDGVACLLQKNQVAGFLLACAYPDRIARRRHKAGYQLANGRSAKFADEPSLGQSRWLAVAEVSAVAGGKGDVIRSAAVFDEQLFDGALKDLLRNETVVEWDRKAGRFVAERRHMVGALVLRSENLAQVPEADKVAALVAYLRTEDLQPLNWSPGFRQFCARIELLRSIEPERGWPRVDAESLRETLEHWLGPELMQVSRLQDFGKLDLRAILAAQLPWRLQQRLEQQAPARIRVPSGSSIAVDYCESPPVLAVKLQEMFGCEKTPTVADGRVALVVHLLSPAGRPLQITQDLAGFWRSSYHEVKKDMKGRYPKHPWPDDPLGATATRKTRRG